jgi:hypothetical protein
MEEEEDLPGTVIRWGRRGVEILAAPSSRWHQGSVGRMDGGWLHLQGGEEAAPAAVPACWRTEATV